MDFTNLDIDVFISLPVNLVLLYFGQLFKRELINNFRFAEGIVNEDVDLCVLAVTLIVLFIIVFKDDNGIRYEKLDELKSVKHKLIKNYDDRVCNTDTIITGTNSLCSNNKSSETNITNTRNVKEELIKHYMTCITEL
ncbi:MAG: hypothetical protein SPJ55_03600 [Treponema sp.]|nr:hypothetical protein [Treponema sp.]